MHFQQSDPCDNQSPNFERLAVVRRLLNQAVDATDPVERLRWVSTWFTAGLQHVFQSWKKPFNPILGETWQVGRRACERSTHPP